MNESVLVLTLAGAITAGTPIILAGLGELLSERAGILNLSVEGTMLLGAIGTFTVVQATDSVILGVVVGILWGALMGGLHAVLSVSFRANQILSGLALFIFASGVARFIGEPHGFTVINRAVTATEIPVLSELPALGPILFRQSIFVYISWVLVALTAFHISRTRLGLSLRAVGEEPSTADTVGINVIRTRYVYSVIGGALAGLAGANLITVIVTSWNAEATVAGLGWIAIGLVVFAAWRPFRLLLGAYVFGLAVRTNFTLQALGFEEIPAEVLRMMPFLITIAALFILARGDLRRRIGAPAALGIPYAREER